MSNLICRCPGNCKCGHKQTETNAERLGDIKEYFRWGIKNGLADRALNDRDILWLIQQAERVQELEQEIDEQIGNESILNKTIGGLRSENARLREALEFYAKEKNWHEGWIQTIEGYVPDVPFAIADEGLIARQALKGESQ